MIQVPEYDHAYVVEQCRLYDETRLGKHINRAASATGLTYKCSINPLEFDKMTERSRAEVLEFLMAKKGIRFNSKLIYLIFDSWTLGYFSKYARDMVSGYDAYLDFRFRKKSKAIEYCLFWKPRVGTPMLNKNIGFELPMRMVWKRWEDFFNTKTYAYDKLTETCQAFWPHRFSVGKKLYSSKNVKFSEGERRITLLDQL
ncbi:MAG: hypothetical protein F6K55_42755 [Moorea sp. SIO4A3]|nr:hypothetical protein [Moorena sp. SIO4A3]